LNLTIDDTLELKREITDVVRKHLTGKCAQHADKVMEWVRTNIRVFVDTVESDLAYFAERIIPIGEKLDAELEKGGK
jgi:hypothetical protein